MVYDYAHANASNDTEHSDAGIVCAEPTFLPLTFYGQRTWTYSSILFLEISAVVLATRIVRFALKPLRQPRIVSEIIGGIFIGPSVLGRNNDFRKLVFPESSDFVLKNIGMMGFIYFLFISGVYLDIGLFKKSGRKHVYIASLGVLLPMVLVSLFAFLATKMMDSNLTKGSSIKSIATSMVVTTFPALYPVLKELNLLNSEIGRMALSSAVISDAIGMVAVVVSEAASQIMADLVDGMWCILSVLLIFVLILFGVRPALAWIIRKTPEGSSVDQAYISAILLGVLVIGFLTDFFGVAMGNGPLWLGLAIPNGPPLGSTIIERSETLIMEVLMPFAFAYVGLCTDVFVMATEWSTVRLLLGFAMAGYLTKFIFTLLAAILVHMPFREGLTLSLIMSIRGQVDLLLFMHWMETKRIEASSFTMLVLISILASGAATPLISILYDPTRPYMVSTRRTIQHAPPNTEIRILFSIYKEENISAFINVLEAWNPNKRTPFAVYGIHLVPLVGRAAPKLIDHGKQEEYSKYSVFDTIHKTMKVYQENRSQDLKYHAYTSVSPKQTVYQDICSLALINEAALIILPFHKDAHIRAELVSQGMRLTNYNVLLHAPCSVGILIDRGMNIRNKLALARGAAATTRPTGQHLMVLFLGGPDAREALSCANCMAENPDVFLTVVRFLSYNGIGDDEMEKKMDDGIITWFRVRNEPSPRTLYREVVVRNGEESLAAIRALHNQCYDLLILGRRNGTNPVLLEGLEDWSESEELGILGDYLTSADFDSSALVLVVQQQILRQQKMPAFGCGKKIYVA